MKKEIFVWVSIIITTLSIVSAAEFNIVIDGDGWEWQTFEKIINDNYAYEKNPSDIINVKAFTYNGYIYSRFKTNGRADKAGDTQWLFRVDTDFDGKEEYQVGFISGKAWVWDLRGSGYSDESNLKYITDFEVKIAKRPEFKIPLSEIGGKEEFHISAGSFKNGNLINPYTEWGSVKPLESAVPAKPKIRVLANSIDYGLASDFFEFLENKGFEVVHLDANTFNEYRKKQFIVILGGPDAPEGVGDIVKEALTANEENAIRESGARKIFVKAHVWTTGQKVLIIAGSNRENTKSSHLENRDIVPEEANSPPTNPPTVETEPTVISTNPQNGETNVDPLLDVISVTFNEPMMESYAWVVSPLGRFPETTGKAYWDSSGTTNYLPVKLEPGKEYAIRINSDNYQSFKDLAGNPAIPYEFIFMTANPLYGGAAPYVISTNPKNGEVDVDPSLDLISVTFNKPMNKMTWAYITDPFGGEFPEMRGNAYYDSNGTTNYFPVKLKSNTEYVIWVNTAEFSKPFKDLNGTPAVPYKLTFKTK